MALALGPQNAYTWSVSNDQLSISPGSVITNGVLTLHNVTFTDTTSGKTLYIHLLDNPNANLKTYSDTQAGDYFDGYGTFLAQINAAGLSSNPSDVVINLSQINDNSSPVWSVFERPFSITIANASQVSLSSAVLSLLDYAGSGSSFGFGFDCDGLSFDGISLKLTVQSMTAVVPSTTLSFSYGNTTLPTSNHAPSISAISDKVVTVGNTLSFSVQATDPDGDTVTISAENAPAGFSLTNNVFTWTPSASQVGIYDVSFNANDGKGGRDSAIVQITVNPLAPTPPTEWTVLAYDDFESGWGNYTDGGSDCLLYTLTKYAPQGSKAANIQNSTGQSVFVLTNAIKVSDYSKVRISFSYIPVSMDTSSEGFRLECWMNQQWVTLKSWFRNIDFQNFNPSYETVEILQSSGAFPANMKIRFVCIGSDDTDDVMIDEITISAK